MSLPSGEQVEIAHHDQRATLVEVGGGLRSYRLGGRAIVDGYEADEMCTAAKGQTLIPWPNRLRGGSYRFDDRELQLPLTEPDKGNAIHGLVRWANWAVGERSEERVEMVHALHPQDGFPFALELSIVYELSDRGLSVTTRATNVGSASCPYGTGAHPYLTVGTNRIDDATLTLPAATWLTTDEHGIPTGERAVEGTRYDFREPRAIADAVLDTAYARLVRDANGLARIVLRAPPKGPQVVFWLDASYPYVMAFTGDSLPGSEDRRRSLGIEPMSCAPNAFRSGEGLATLEPGESHSGRWGIQPTEERASR